MYVYIVWLTQLIESSTHPEHRDGQSISIYRLWCVDRRSAKRLKLKQDDVHTIHIVLSYSMKSSVFKCYCQSVLLLEY